MPSYLNHFINARLAAKFTVIKRLGTGTTAANATAIRLAAATEAAGAHVWARLNASGRVLMKAGSASLAPALDFAKVVWLTHANGADGGVAFTDASSYARAITVDGSATTQTAVKKYGSASLFCSTTLDGVSIANAAELSHATGDFSYEAWIYPTVSAQNTLRNLWMKYAFTSIEPVRIQITTLNVLKAYSTDGAGIPLTTLTDPSVIAHDTWMHVAYCRVGDQFTLYRDGVAVATAAVPGAVVGTNTGAMAFSGKFASGLIGYADDLRVVIGASAYSANFTPPTAELPNS